MWSAPAVQIDTAVETHSADSSDRSFARATGARKIEAKSVWPCFAAIFARAIRWMGDGPSIPISHLEIVVCLVNRCLPSDLSTAAASLSWVQLIRCRSARTATLIVSCRICVAARRLVVPSWCCRSGDAFSSIALILKSDLPRGYRRRICVRYPGNRGGDPRRRSRQRCADRD